MASQSSAGKRLYGPTVQYADGTVIKGKLLKVDSILRGFERADANTRSSFHRVFAHDLTVAIRALLIDRPVPEADLDRVWKINEFLHQLTSCANPRRRWTAREEAELVRSIVETSFNYGLEQWVGHALAVAAGSALGTQTMPQPKAGVA